MSVEINDLVGLSQPLTKLVEVIGAGLGKIYEPTYIKRLAVAKAEETKLLTSAKTSAEIDSKKQLIAFDESRLQLQNISDDVLERTKTRLLTREINHQLNIDSVVSSAVQAMGETVSAEPVDVDWINRFFSIAQDISEPKMQQIWGQILSGETTAPGRFSLRSIETLRNVSQHEAEIFSRACSLCTGINELIIKIPPEQPNLIFIHDEESIKNLGLPYSDVMSLVEAGLFHPETNSSLSWEVNSIKLFNNGKFFNLTNLNEETKKIELHVYRFTKAGMALGTLIPNNFNQSYFELLSKRFLNHGIQVTLEDEIKV